MTVVIVGVIEAGAHYYCGVCLGDWQRSFVSRYHALLSFTAAGTEPCKCDCKLPMIVYCDVYMCVYHVFSYYYVV